MLKQIGGDWHKGATTICHGVTMKRWHLESIVSIQANRRSKKLDIPDWRVDGLFSGRRKIDFRHETKLDELKRRLSSFFLRRVC